jgi:hypothetical protein
MGSSCALNAAVHLDHARILHLAILCGLLDGVIYFTYIFSDLLSVLTKFEYMWLLSSHILA